MAKSLALGSSAPGQPLGDLLEQPGVAVGVAERGEGRVAPALRVGAGDTRPLPRVVEHPARVVEGVADVDAALDELAAGPCDVVDDQVQAFGRPGGRGADA